MKNVVQTLPTNGWEIGYSDAAVISRESSALQSTTCMALQTRNQKQNQQRSLGLVRPFKTNRVENNKRKGKSFFT